ncbi:peptidoglycan D,D-transpeptidase FtsI family protein [Anaerosalibacter sp. Marseille-P3206]|uniref:peptidoglycan D,D-transpeptidase FtsI family protein n=1 Tax=Anaerosalibacter sp. Marseille-P3206 TaxID=1871005 RepID=UPI000984371F|nr:penicillin-binding protein 2 [Anaerosalibacter sp. Marseille-P3206]
MRRNRKNPLKNRIIKFSLVVFCTVMLLVGRLFWFQVIKSDEYKLAALKQRGKEVKLYPDRGIIYDRNLIPLTNRDRVSTVYFTDDSSFDEYLRNNNTYTKEKDKNNNKIKSIELEKEINEEELPKGAYVYDKTLRYDKNNLLSHVIGYIKKSENRGESGIEKVFDEVLKNHKLNSIFFEVDNKRRIIPGGGYAVVKDEKSSFPNSVQLTIDYHIQKIVENEMDKRKIKGAVIVADVETGEIVAMASRPNFDQDNIDAYFNKDNMELYNKAIQVSYPPGSLFKIVVLLTALEEEPSIVNEIFYCNGYEKINDVIIKCNKEEGHGYISLSEAFSKSCNSTFIQIGQRIGSKKIIDMAYRLGFGEKINIGLFEETEGNLPSGKELLGPSIGNISIGQGKIEVTPLQVTNMMLTLANEGINKKLSIIKGIVTEDGYMVKEFRKDSEERIISAKNAKILDDLMGKVVKTGTGRSMDLEDVGGACGKTGSAQAVLNGEKTIHGWFSGYFPENNPKYVITVFAEQVNSGSMSAVPIFENIVKEISQKNR